MDKSSDWWFARLVRDTTADGVVGRQGWVSGSFLAHFTGELSPEEEASLMAGTVDILYIACMYSMLK